MMVRALTAAAAFYFIFSAHVLGVTYYPAFPRQFSGGYDDNTGWIANVSVELTEENGHHLVKADVVQKGSPSYATDGHFIIYSRPPGALRGMRAFNHTILFYLTNNTCTYTASIPTLTAEMPFGFANLLGFNMTDVCVGWQVCSGMKYLETLIYFNKKTDVWFKQIPNASGQPDNITVLVDSKTHIPITATRVHPGHPGTFDPPRTIKTFDLVTSESPNAQFTLPSQWQLKCQNLDAKVLTDSQSLFYVTPKGGDFLHVWLSDMPVEGNVTVTFHVNPIPPCPCTDCIMFNPPTLTFTSSNYTQEQVVEFVYEKDGVTNFMFTVDGGGYYNRGSNKEYGTIYTCHNGIPRKSCPSSWQ